MSKNLEELIKKNKGILRQLTALNNEVKKLKSRVKALERGDSYYPNVGELIKRLKILKSGGQIQIKKERRKNVIDF